MTSQPFIWAYMGGAIALAALWLGTRDKARRMAGDALLTLLTIFVLHFLFLAVSTQKLGSTNTSVATDQTEMQLRVVACVESLRRNMQQGIGGIFGKGQELPATLPALAPAEEKQRRQALQTARDALEAAIKANPKNALYAAKLIIIRAEMEEKPDRQQMSALVSKLMTDPADMKLKALGQAMDHIYVQRELAKGELPEFESAIKSALPEGWYRDHALFKLYEVGKDKKKLAEYASMVDSKNIAVLFKLAVFFVLYAVAAVVGAINILIQLGMMARRGQPPPDAVRLDVPLKTLFAVFIGWFSVYLMMSTIAHYLIAQFTDIGKQPNLVAFSTASSYIVSNISAPLLIYFLVLKPQNISLRDGLRLKMSSSTAGPVKIVFSGILGWCSAIPLVLVALLIATQYLGTGRSDNPVIGQIVQAASAANPMAIILFYFTLGVLAPFFEEILFRGFLYGALKPRIGTVFSLIASAGLFALIHFDKGGVLMLFAIGFVLAFTFEKTRSLIPSMIAHGLWNSGSFTLALLLFSS